MNDIKDIQKNDFSVKVGLAEMLKGGAIMDVTNAEQAKIAEDAGACAVMALERIPSDIRRDGGVARMSDPFMIEEIKNTVSIPVMAKCRIGHFAEAALGHHRDRHGVLDFLDHERIGHARNAAIAADVGRDALQRHHRAGAGVLGDFCLFGIGHVHDRAALEHFSEADLDGKIVLPGVFYVVHFDRVFLAGEGVVNRVGQRASLAESRGGHNCDLRGGRRGYCDAPVDAAE